MKNKKQLLAFKILIIIIISTVGLVHNYMKRPDVSVVMLTYQRADLLPNAIESILGQTYKNFEFIIINDGSQDDTSDVVKKYKDKRIRYYENKINKGISYSRNRALELARGKYVMIMDDDDVSLPDRMEKQISYLKKHPEVDAVAGQIKDLPRIPKTHDEIVVGLIQYNNFGNANVMYRKSFSKRNNLHYDEKITICEDWKFWLDFVFSGGKMASIDDDILIRNEKSKKHYKIQYDIMLHIKKYIGNYFTPADYQKFYSADSCQKIDLIEPKKIISSEFISMLRKSNCPILKVH